MCSIKENIKTIKMDPLDILARIKIHNQKFNQEKLFLKQEFLKLDYNLRYYFVLPLLILEIFIILVLMYFFDKDLYPIFVILLLIQTIIILFGYQYCFFNKNAKLSYKDEYCKTNNTSDSFFGTWFISKLRKEKYYLIRSYYSDKEIDLLLDSAEYELKNKKNNRPLKGVEYLILGLLPIFIAIIVDINVFSDLLKKTFKPHINIDLEEKLIFLFLIFLSGMIIAFFYWFIKQIIFKKSKSNTQDLKDFISTMYFVKTLEKK